MELRECPFCGGEAYIEDQAEMGGIWCVFCRDCDAAMTNELKHEATILIAK